MNIELSFFQEINSLFGSLFYYCSEIVDVIPGLAYLAFVIIILGLLSRKDPIERGLTNNLAFESERWVHNNIIAEY